MKKNSAFILGLASVILACPLLSGCGSETITPVALDHGQLWNSTNDDVKNPNGHFYFYNKASDNSTSYFIPYLYLGKLIEQKANFVLIVVGSSDGCSCWTGFRNNVLTKYMKAKNLQVYLIRADAISAQSDHYGLSIYPSTQNVAIFKDGAVKYQAEQREGQPFSDDYATFAAWMDARVSVPHFLEVNNAQLDALYTGIILGESKASLSEFTILFSYFDCPDCQYLDSSFLRSYNIANAKLETYYFIDVGVNGIRWTNAVKDVAQWDAWKAKYGLSVSEANPAGFDSGYVPTLYNIQCTDAGTKTGDVIQGAATFYNDSLVKQNDGTYAIGTTFFTEARLKLASLAYLNESSVATKVFTGYNVGNYSGTESDPNDDRPWYHSVTEGISDPIAKLFLDTYVGQAKTLE